MYYKHAYTLIELLVTLFLIGTLALLAIPSWRDWLNTTATAAQVNQLIAVINFARSEAVKHNINISICPSSDGIICADKWTTSYLVFVNSARAAQTDRTTTVLRFFPNHSAKGTLKWEGKGILHLNAQGAFFTQNGVFRYCPYDNDMRYAREIIISTTGRIRTTQQLTRPCFSSAG